MTRRRRGLSRSRDQRLPVSHQANAQAAMTASHSGPDNQKKGRVSIDVHVSLVGVPRRCDRDGLGRGPSALPTLPTRPTPGWAAGLGTGQGRRPRKDLLPGKSAARLAEYGTAVPDQLPFWDEP
jgi:hypothetical protein